MKKIILAIIPLVAIAAIAIGVGMSSNVLAQPTVPTTTQPTIVDLPDGPNDVADKQNASDAAHNGTDNQKDGETNDDHNSTKVTSGDGEQPDATEE